LYFEHCIITVQHKISSDAQETPLQEPAASPPVHHRKNKKKNFVLVSSSDEEADTLKDHFWKDLEKGVLPEDLCSYDLYSSV